MMACEIVHDITAENADIERYMENRRHFDVVREGGLLLDGRVPVWSVHCTNVETE